MRGQTDGGQTQGDKTEQKADRIEAASITDAGRALGGGGRLRQRAAAGVVQHTGPARVWAGMGGWFSISQMLKKQELSRTFEGSLALNSTTIS